MDHEITGWEDGALVGTAGFQYPCSSSSSSSEDYDTSTWEMVFLKATLQTITEKRPDAWRSHLAALAHAVRVPGFETIGKAAEKSKVTPQSIHRAGSNLAKRNVMPQIRDLMLRLRQLERGQKGKM